MYSPYEVVLTMLKIILKGFLSKYFYTCLFTIIL